MTLDSTAYLVIDEDALEPASDDGVFEFEVDTDYNHEVDKDYLVGGRGQLLSAAFDLATDLGDAALDFGLDEDDPGVGSRRRGYDVDGGAGNEAVTLSFESGLDAQWGDGSGDPVSETDATESNLLIDKDNILQYWISQTRTDSQAQAEFHWGQWTDGRFSGSAGVYGEPMYVAVRSAVVDVDTDEPAAVTGTLEISRTRTFAGAVESADEALDFVLDR